MVRGTGNGIGVGTGVGVGIGPPYVRGASRRRARLNRGRTGEGHEGSICGAALAQAVADGSPMSVGARFRRSRGRCCLASLDVNG